jgi:hypothetical protein
MRQEEDLERTNSVQNVSTEKVRGCTRPKRHGTREALAPVLMVHERN